ncbi:uncharacterized protein DS421_19g675090 [Arachis hypogaea]|uniref:Uncharacterized protein n=1 Tax=Arachis hypogaea TaxID=3818 RepID=A0A6B9VEP3_ARAHY|nr:uncharacterized protein DS421_19g675090 [Arachis hypogaea]
MRAAVRAEKVDLGSESSGDLGLLWGSDEWGSMRNELLVAEGLYVEFASLVCSELRESSRDKGYIWWMMMMLIDEEERDTCQGLLLGARGNRHSSCQIFIDMWLPLSCLSMFSTPA